MVQGTPIRSRTPGWNLIACRAPHRKPPVGRDGRQLRGSCALERDPGAGACSSGAARVLMVARNGRKWRREYRARGSRSWMRVTFPHLQAPETVVRLAQVFSAERFGPGLFDNLVGAGEERLRYGEAERLGGLQIDDQLEFGRLLGPADRRAWRPEDLADPRPQLGGIGPTGRLGPIAGPIRRPRPLLPQTIDRRQCVALRQCRELIALIVEECVIGRDQQRQACNFHESGKRAHHLALGFRGSRHEAADPWPERGLAARFSYFPAAKFRPFSGSPRAQRTLARGNEFPKSTSSRSVRVQPPLSEN